MTLLSPVIAMARQSAEREAVRLIAYSSTVFPSLEEKLGDLVVEELIETRVSFAVNARRCLENSRIDPMIDSQRWNYDLDLDNKLEKNIKRALNGIVHAKHLRIHWAASPVQIFPNSSNSVILHFVYETDRYPETYVDVFGMAWAFITTPQSIPVKH